MDALTLLRQGPVVPVIVVNDAAVAVDLARALVDGGIRVLMPSFDTLAVARAGKPTVGSAKPVMQLAKRTAP